MPKPALWALALLLLSSLFLAACTRDSGLVSASTEASGSTQPVSPTDQLGTPAVSGEPSSQGVESAALSDTERLPTPTALPQVIVPDVRGLNGPVRIPDYFQSIPFDGIYPVYDPVFVNAVDSPLHQDELVMGVAWDGEAKAYPVTVLRFREMVNDELAGLPILVTW